MSTPGLALNLHGSTSRPPEERSDAENKWVSLQPYLQSRGYQLRPRYQPDWVPSWKVTGARPSESEDSIDALPIRVLDATRTRDGLQVVIKMLITSHDNREGEYELEILQHFSSPLYSQDITNHTVPCLDSFPIPGEDGGMFVVMPLLSKYSDPPFHDLSEVHDFLTQIFEGLAFLHGHNIAHCDIASANIMMDKRPLYEESFHPFHQHRTLDGKRRILPKHVRSQRPVRYYYIDFGYAKWFKDISTSRTVSGVYGKERAPEQLAGAPHDPFKVDIYQLGAIVRRDLIPVRLPVILPHSE
ncbi:kinase domain protein [Ceratobasidium sp. AG-Ba]|nr:kinase domain protein [Ceratobasidium sp. AG-Ba]QRW01207.1 kinase domain protein [Ceratobasidium sp. AG-Ba]